MARFDFNVPLEKGEVVDDYRIGQAVPTIEWLVEKGARVVLASHLGRPGGKKVSFLSLSPVQEALLLWLDRSVVLADDCIGKKIEKWTKEMKKGEILLLENLRFREGEEEGDKRFGKRLARLGDIYINEAFSVSHRAHASLVWPPRLLPSGVGLLFEKEVRNLSRVTEEPERPVVGIVGGAKVKSKGQFLDKLLEKADLLLAGGKVGEVLKKDKSLKDKNILFPRDGVGEDGNVFDIGPETIDVFKEEIRKAGTVFWAGPMGKFEDERYARGTKEVGKAVAESKAFTVVGGGDTVSFIREKKIEGFNHVSTGGGAMLYFLAEGTLPALKDL